MNAKILIDFLDNYLLGEKKLPWVDLRVMQDHEEIFSHRAGVTDLHGQKPAANTDLYYIYSCTKPMTCAAAMQLVEQGKLGLDDPVSKYLPAYADAFLLQDGAPVKPQNTMTVRHLFTMSAGLDYVRTKAPIRRVLEENPMATTQEVVDSFIRSPLNFEPGDRFFYSLCHDVLAAVIEAISGMRFSDYLRKNIWEPLGMTRTGFHPTQEQRQELVWHFKYDAMTKRIVPKKDQNCLYCLGGNYDSGGAGLFSCADDYRLFADAMACGGVGRTGNRILKAETIDLMRQDQTRMFWKPEDPTDEDNSEYNYGLGVRTRVRKQGRGSLGEFGWDGAAGAYTLMDPAHKLSVFFGMSVTGWTGLLTSHVLLRDKVYESLGIE